MHRLASSIWLLLALLLAACAGPTRLDSDLGVRGAPDWVNKGTAYVNDRDGRLFHGVGAAAPMGARSLQVATADDRARAEVARIFSTYVDALSRDYQAASRAGDAAVNEQTVSRQISSLTRVNLAGARIIARWRDPRSDTVYSIAELDMRRVKETLAAARDMNQDVRGHIAANADNLFDRMAREAE